MWLCEHFSGTKFCVPWMEKVSQRRGSTVIGCGMEELSLSKIRRGPALERERFLSIHLGLKSTNWPLHFVPFQKNGLFCEMQGKKKILQIGYRHCFYSFIPFNLFIYLFIYLLICLFFFQIKELDWTATGEVSISNDESLLLCAELDRWV